MVHWAHAGGIGHHDVGNICGNTVGNAAEFCIIRGVRGVVSECGYLPFTLGVECE